MFALLCFSPVCLEMSKHYNQKASLEQELPTVTQKLCTTTDCLLGSLGSLTSSTGKVRPTGGRHKPRLYLYLDVQAVAAAC